MKHLFRSLIIPVLFLQSACSFLPVSYNDIDLFNNIENKYAIDIYTRKKSNFFPNEWLSPPINASFSRLEKKEAHRFALLLEKALSKYPLQVISANLNAIGLSKKLTFYGVAYGGTYTANTIYLSSKGEKQGYSDKYLISNFHHEFSSILLWNYPFPKEKWISSNPDNFQYQYERSGRKAGLEALKNEVLHFEGSEELYKKGFLTRYSLSGFEEDFNIYSAFILGNSEEFRTLMDKYKAIEKKFRIWLEFYNSIDKSFTSVSLFNQ